MDQTVFALMILPGETAAARAFLTELEGERKGQYATSQARLALTKEVRAIQPGPQGDLYVVYFAGEDIGPGGGSEHAAARADERDPLRLPGVKVAPRAPQHFAP